MAQSGGSLLRSWERWRGVPGGRWLFSRIVGLRVPYSGTIGAQVHELRPGYALLSLRDRRKVRQHLGSVHAVALLNLGELTSGLAMLTALPPGLRAIVTRLSAEYFKKARGRLSAEATVVVPEVTGPVELPVVAEVRDSAGEVVCRVAGAVARGRRNSERRPVTA